MAVNSNLVTMKVNVPNPEIQNTEITFENTGENIEYVLNMLRKINPDKVSGWNIRTLTPRNPYGASGMPVEVKRQRLLDELAKLDSENAA